MQNKWASDFAHICWLAFNESRDIKFDEKKGDEDAYLLLVRTIEQLEELKGKLVAHKFSKTLMPGEWEVVQRHIKDTALKNDIYLKGIIKSCLSELKDK